MKQSEFKPVEELLVFMLLLATLITIVTVACSYFPTKPVPTRAPVLPATLDAGKR
jgi:hypothetical protein